MNRIARFEKVSESQFAEAWRELFGSDEGASAALRAIPLPRRATVGSAGYDFALPFDLTLQPGETAKIPTGIRARIAEGWVLMIYPRSGLGFKYRLQLNNTVGVIDSDYYH
ncbi:MAG: deoxyuridine 5'-triphosphate nucleotidohydrolase, partial [Clostridia bacterium]|nr:deoxyuridine 5'-triphosphate nucleotidohydrolase [Clostridia bacterium]